MQWVWFSNSSKISCAVNTLPPSVLFSSPSPPSGDGSGPPMGFEFTTDPASAEHILKLWTICRLDSCGPDKLREISSALDPVAAGGERGGGKARRTPKKSPTVREKGSKEKQDSRALFRNHTLGRERGEGAWSEVVGMVWRGGRGLWYGW